MNPSRRMILAGALALGLLAAAAGCRQKVESEMRTAARVLEPYRGRVLVLLMGMPGCDGTARADRFLSSYVARKPDGVEILRLDVPPPNGILGAQAGRIGGPFPCQIDYDRLVATHLEFFFYPTLYLFDRDGEIRFAGDCEEARVEAMVAELAAEPPGATKIYYTQPLPKIGTPAAAFKGVTAAGRALTLPDVQGARATLLFFGATFCPYSQAATVQLPKLAADYQARGVRVAVVNIGETAETIGRYYEEKAPGLAVLVDPAKEIARAYGVGGVPFFFVIKANGTIAARQPYTDAVARQALDEALGVRSAQPPPQPAAGAG